MAFKSQKNGHGPENSGLVGQILFITPLYSHFFIKISLTALEAKRLNIIYRLQIVRIICECAC